MRKCSKCGYERMPRDDNLVPAGECPKCGVVYEKFEVYLAQQRAEEELKLSRQKLLRSKADDIWRRVESGQKAYLYEDVYLPVDSIINENPVCSFFDISILRTFGLDGWDVVAVIPRTIGVGLTNVSVGSATGHTWGGGIGGNVVGVHIVLRKEIFFGEKTDLDPQLLSFLDKQTPPD